MRRQRAAALLTLVVVLVAVALVARRLPPEVPPPSPTPTEVALPGIASAGAANGDAWAIQGQDWLVSSDGGVSWHRSTLPVDPRSVLAVGSLDADHAWLATVGPGSGPQTGSPTDLLFLAIERTDDQGATWETSSVPGSHPAHDPALVFLDQRHGYLLLSAGRFSDGMSVVLRTDDRGATWNAAGQAPGLGPLFAVSDASTLWAGAPESAAGVKLWSFLEVSRDAGRTWSEVGLPGLAGASGGTWLAGPPVFVDPATGFVTVTSMQSAQPRTLVYRTADRGRSWTVVSDQPVQAGAGPAILDAAHWLLPVVNPFGLRATSNGGATWRDLPIGEFANGGWISWIGAIDARHTLALVPTGHSFPGPALLYLSADGGATWSASP